MLLLMMMRIRRPRSAYVRYEATLDREYLCHHARLLEFGSHDARGLCQDALDLEELLVTVVARHTERHLCLDVVLEVIQVLEWEIQQHAQIAFRLGGVLGLLEVGVELGVLLCQPVEREDGHLVVFDVGLVGW